jgi:hypothetical protein
VSMSNEYYASVAAEARMAELRREAETWRLARAVGGPRLAPTHKLRSLPARIAAASRQARRHVLPRDREPQPCGC